MRCATLLFPLPLNPNFPLAPLSQKERQLFASHGSRPESRPESKLALQLESPLAAKLVWLLAEGPLGKAALAQALGHASVSGELNKQVTRLLAQMLIEMTLPDKPNSRLQKYRLTERGQAMLTEQQRNP